MFANPCDLKMIACTETQKKTNHFSPEGALIPLYVKLLFGNGSCDRKIKFISVQQSNQRGIRERDKHSQKYV